MAAAPWRHRQIAPAVAGSAALVVAAWVFLVASGVRPLEGLSACVVVGLQGWAGAVVWRWIRPAAGDPAELIGFGLALGTASSVVAGLLVRAALNASWGWAVPIVIVAVLAGVRRIRDGRDRPTHGWVDSISGWPIFAFTIVVSMASLVPNLLRYPLTWQGTWSGYHADMLYFEALANSLAGFGPLNSIFTPDALIRYHWITYAWTGQVADAAHLSSFVGLTRILPLVAVVGTCFIAIAWARRISPVRWVPVLAVLLLIFGGYVGATYGAIFNFDSPSQALTMLWLLAMSLTLVITCEGEGRRWPAVAGVMLLGFVLAGGKVSAGAVALIAVVTLCAVALARRLPWRVTALGLTVATSAGLALGYAVVVAGSANPGGLRILQLLDRASSVQGLNPVPGALGIVAGTMIMILALSARWAGLLWLVGSRRTRWSPSAILGIGFALAGVGTAAVLSGGLNDMWFALAASAPLAVVSAAGAGNAWASLPTGTRSRGIMALVLVGSAVIAGLVAGLWLTGASGGNVWVATWRWAGPITAVIGAALIGTAVAAFARPTRRIAAVVAGSVIALVFVSAPGRLLGFGSGQVGVQPGLSNDAFAPIEEYVPGVDEVIVRAWTSDEVATAERLRSASTPQDLVVTNVTFSPLVPALTGRQTVASGILYQAPYGRPGAVPALLERERMSWSVIDHQDGRALSAVCALGAKWAWIDPRRTSARDWSAIGTPVIAGESVVLVDLRCPR